MIPNLTCRFPATLHKPPDLPDNLERVIVLVRRDNGSLTWCKGYYVRERSIECGYEDDLDCDYDEDSDTYFMPEGWYESIEHWPDYSSVKIYNEVIGWARMHINTE